MTCQPTLAHGSLSRITLSTVVNQEKIPKPASIHQAPSCRLDPKQEIWREFSVSKDLSSKEMKNEQTRTCSPNRTYYCNSSSPQESTSSGLHSEHTRDWIQKTYLTNYFAAWVIHWVSVRLHSLFCKMGAI